MHHRAEHPECRSKILAGSPTFLGMVRVARNSNTAVLLNGEGVIDSSVDLVNAIQHAEQILGWYENMSSDEIPPTWMWPFADELNEWFEEVKLAREQKYSGGSDWDSMVSNEWEPD